MRDAQQWESKISFGSVGARALLFHKRGWLFDRLHESIYFIQRKLHSYVFLRRLCTSMTVVNSISVAISLLVSMVVQSRL